MKNNFRVSDVKLPSSPKTLGQRSADALTDFCGSWKFIISLCVFITIWISANIILLRYIWDPWPFVLLNLVLSCLATLQAPIILMSAKREEERDRLRQNYDYLVDRKAAKDVATILEKIEKMEKKLK
jgi:uncharacterized membrane protein